MFDLPDTRTSLPLLRFNGVAQINSHLDVLGDLLTFLRFCTAEEYVKDLLATVHGVPEPELDARARAVTSFVRASVDLAHDAFRATPELSFLPGYYSVLNALKVIILLRPLWGDLSANRHHGASYEGVKIDYPRLDDEEIKVREAGVIPLAHRTITGTALTPGLIRIGDVYPFLSAIGAEYGLAYGREASLAGVAALLRHHDLPNKTKEFSIELRCHTGADIQKATALPPDIVRESPGSTGNQSLWTWGEKSPNAEQLIASFRAACRPALFHDIAGSSHDWFSGTHFFTIVSLDRGGLVLPEEIGLALFFFHLSNVVRYKPDQLYKARSTRIWPFAQAGSRHALFRALVLLWSHIHGKHLMLNSPR
jgi:hypothetical protein